MAVKLGLLARDYPGVDYALFTTENDGLSWSNVPLASGSTYRHIVLIPPPVGNIPRVMLCPGGHLTNFGINHLYTSNDLGGTVADFGDLPTKHPEHDDQTFFYIRSVIVVSATEVYVYADYQNTVEDRDENDEIQYTTFDNYYWFKTVNGGQSWSVDNTIDSGIVNPRFDARRQRVHFSVPVALKGDNVFSVRATVRTERVGELDVYRVYLLRSPVKADGVHVQGSIKFARTSIRSTTAIHRVGLTYKGDDLYVFVTYTNGVKCDIFKAVAANLTDVKFDAAVAAGTIELVFVKQATYAPENANAATFAGSIYGVLAWDFVGDGTPEVPDVTPPPDMSISSNFFAFSEETLQLIVPGFSRALVDEFEDGMTQAQMNTYKNDTRGRSKCFDVKVYASVSKTVEILEGHFWPHFMNNVIDTPASVNHPGVPNLKVDLSLVDLTRPRTKPSVYLRNDENDDLPCLFLFYLVKEYFVGSAGRWRAILCDLVSPEFLRGRSPAVGRYLFIKNINNIGILGSIGFRNQAGNRTWWGNKGSLRIEGVKTARMQAHLKALLDAGVASEYPYNVPSLSGHNGLYNYTPKAGGDASNPVNNLPNVEEFESQNLIGYDGNLASWQVIIQNGLNAISTQKYYDIVPVNPSKADQYKNSYSLFYTDNIGGGIRINDDGNRLTDTPPISIANYNSNITAFDDFIFGVRSPVDRGLLLNKDPDFIEHNLWVRLGSYGSGAWPSSIVVCKKNDVEYIFYSGFQILLISRPLAHIIGIGGSGFYGELTYRNASYVYFPNKRSALIGGLGLNKIFVTVNDGIHAINVFNSSGTLIVPNISRVFLNRSAIVKTLIQSTTPTVDYINGVSGTTETFPYYLSITSNGTIDADPTILYVIKTKALAGYRSIGDSRARCFRYSYNNGVITPYSDDVVNNQHFPFLDDPKIYGGSPELLSEANYGYGGYHPGTIPVIAYFRGRLFVKMLAHSRNRFQNAYTPAPSSDLKVYNALTGSQLRERTAQDRTELARLITDESNGFDNIYDNLFTFYQSSDGNTVSTNDKLYNIRYHGGYIGGAARVVGTRINLQNNLNKIQRYDISLQVPAEVPTPTPDTPTPEPEDPVPVVVTPPTIINASAINNVALVLDPTKTRYGIYSTTYFEASGEREVPVLVTEPQFFLYIYDTVALRFRNVKITLHDSVPSVGVWGKFDATNKLDDAGSFKILNEPSAATKAHTLFNSMLHLDTTASPKFVFNTTLVKKGETSAATALPISPGSGITPYLLIKFLEQN